MCLSNVPTLTRRNLLKVGTVAISGFDLLPMLRPLNASQGDGEGARHSGNTACTFSCKAAAVNVDSFDLKEAKWTPPDFEVKQVAPDVKMPVSLFPKLSLNFSKIAILRFLEAWETEHERLFTTCGPGFSPARIKEIPSVGAIVAYESRGKPKDSDFLPPFMSMNYGHNQEKQGA